jgi:hypothetical protein
VDYDRALETLACHSCKGRFTEPDVKARCGRCRRQYETDALLERRFSSFRLTSAGEFAARSGSAGNLFALIDDLSAHPAYFSQTLQWMAELARRHRDVYFSLIALRFRNLQELAAVLPRRQVAQMIDALAHRMRELVRSTDFFMRDDQDLCWLLLPQTSAAGLEVLRGRLEALSAASAQPDGRRIELSLAALTSADLADGAVDARAIMGRLSGST